MIFIASDHAGYELKEMIKPVIESLGYSYYDLGTNNQDLVDYPDYANMLVKYITNLDDKGILLCGSGVGMSIAANRHKGIRAALCYTEEQAILSRQHGNCNILCLGGRIHKLAQSRLIIRGFLTSEFDGGRHLKRIEKLDE